jgi:hypothetical protein
MSLNLQAKRCAFEAHGGQKGVRPQKVIKTTLGELIVALTDEVVPFVREPSALYKVVSWALNDVLNPPSPAYSKAVTTKISKPSG